MCVLCKHSPLAYRLTHTHTALHVFNGVLVLMGKPPCCCRPAFEPLFTLVFPQINVHVTTMDAELEFAIQPSTLGKQLVEQVLHISGHHHCSKATVYPSELKQLLILYRGKKREILKKRNKITFMLLTFNSANKATCFMWGKKTQTV